MLQSPLDELRRLLRAKWVAPRYSARALRELEDHFADLERAAQDRGLQGSDVRAVATQVLGDVRSLAQELVDGLRRQSLAGRHPWITFALLPLPVLVVAARALGRLASASFSREMLTAPSLPRWAHRVPGTRAFSSLLN